MTDGSDQSASPDIDVEVGDTLETAGRTLTEADLVNFAGVSGDFNHLHTDAEGMEETAYGERIIHGALVFAAMTGLVWQARDSGEVVAFYGVDQLRFVAPVFVGDTITVELEVTDIEATEHPDAEAIVRHEAVVTNQHGESVLTCQPLALLE